MKLAASAPGPVSGRLLIFAKRGHGDSEVDSQEFHPQDTWVAATDVHDLAPGDSAEIDADEVAFPGPFSTMPAGNWEVQAVLDPEHTYNYSGRGPEDWVGPVLALPSFPASAHEEPILTLDRHPAVNPDLQQLIARAHTSLKGGEIEQQTMVSPLLTGFWGRTRQIQAWVVLPPGYTQHPERHYPTVYWMAGFGGSAPTNLARGAQLRQRMIDGKMPPMIWVMLDESLPEGTHEFADSVNNGPWGAALTAEFIPMLESKYRMDARPQGRLLNGHSSGGWATLQLQVNYPQIFGGTWSTSPDPSDFHDFTGVDLYAPNANMYRHADGTAVPIMRAKGKVVATMQQFAQLEDVIGPYGGQLSSFDWVFSPKSDSGAPEPMFDRKTGAVHPEIVAYWAAHYDLANIVERTWAARGALLTGRIHLTVGTADTFYLDGAAHLFEARLQKLGAEPHFTYLPGRTHMDLYVVGSDRSGLFDQIGAQMYAVARPGESWKQP